MDVKRVKRQALEAIDRVRTGDPEADLAPDPLGADLMVAAVKLAVKQGKGRIGNVRLARAEQAAWVVTDAGEKFYLHASGHFHQTMPPPAKPIRKPLSSAAEAERLLRRLGMRSCVVKVDESDAGFYVFHTVSQGQFRVYRETLVAQRRREEGEEWK